MVSAPNHIETNGTSNGHTNGSSLNKKIKVVQIGAGLGGLTLAATLLNSLESHNIDYALYESAGAITEIVSLF